MNRFDLPFLRLALAGALVASFGLAACGRKGPLDLPPSAMSATGKQKPADTSLIRSPFGGQANKGQKSESTASRAPHKHFILDPLLN